MRPIFYKNRIYSHLLFWAVVLLFFFIVEVFSSNALRKEPVYIKLYWINFFFESLPTYIFFTYMLLYTVVPRFLQRKYISSAIAFLSVILLTLLLQKVFSEIDLYFIQPYIFNFSNGLPFTFSSILADLTNVNDWITLTYDFALVGFVAAAIKIFNTWVKAQNESIYLEQEKLRAELQLIKTQINPDFLFNTLQDLHQLTLQQSDLAPGIVLKLASLLSYLLYESQAEEVLLEKEIEMIHNYIHLTEVHKQGVTEISQQVSGDIKGKRIAPLLLLPLLEYAVRKEDCMEQSWASIDLSVKEEVLKLIIIKGTNDTAAVRFDNVKKRLDNLYPERYELKMIAEEDTLLIKLTLVLNADKLIKSNHPYETELLTD